MIPVKNFKYRDTVEEETGKTFRGFNIKKYTNKYTGIVYYRGESYAHEIKANPYPKAGIDMVGNIAYEKDQRMCKLDVEKYAMVGGMVGYGASLIGYIWSLGPLTPAEMGGTLAFGQGVGTIALLGSVWVSQPVVKWLNKNKHQVATGQIVPVGTPFFEDMPGLVKYIKELQSQSNIYDVDKPKDFTRKTYEDCEY